MNDVLKDFFARQEQQEQREIDEAKRVPKPNTRPHLLDEFFARKAEEEGWAKK